MYEHDTNWLKYLWDINQLQNPQSRFYELDITNRCDGCVSTGFPSHCCSNDARAEPIRDMSEEMFDELVTRALKEKNGIVLTGGGEPLLHPQIESFVNVLIEILEDELIGFGIVTNGKGREKIALIGRILNRIPITANFWIRISLNDRVPEPELIRLFEQYPKRIGLSLLSPNDVTNESQVYKNYNLFAKTSKFNRIGKFNPLDIPSEIQTPVKCVGRKFVKIFNALGEQQYCCLSRGMHGSPPPFCPAWCRWEKVNLQKCWEMNPFT